MGTTVVTPNGSPERSNRSRDTESGRFTTEYPSEAFFQAIEDEGGLAATGDIARHVGCTHDAAYKRLAAMEDLGLVIRRRFGQTLTWRIPPKDRYNEDNESDLDPTKA